MRESLLALKPCEMLVCSFSTGSYKVEQATDPLLNLNRSSVSCLLETHVIAEEVLKENSREASPAF